MTPRRLITLALKTVAVLVGVVAVFYLAIGLWLFIITPRPTHNQARLAAIRAEAQQLMATQRIGSYYMVSPNKRDRHAEVSGDLHLPPVIASLKPDYVTVWEQGVMINTKMYFDGGWGYFVARTERDHLQPEGRCSELSQRIYWCHPY